MPPASTAPARYVLRGANHGDLAFLGDHGSGRVWTTTTVLDVVTGFLRDRLAPVSDGCCARRLRHATPDEPATPRPRRDARENRERVLLEAAAVLAEHGLTATPADVAKAAGVGVGTLYRRFPDKDELILAVYQARMDAAVALAERSSTAADPGSAFREFIEHGAHDFSTDRGFRELVLGGLTDALGWSRSGAARSLSQAVDRMNTAVSGHLAVLLERVKAAGSLRQDVAPTDVQLINAAVQSVAGVAGLARPGIHQRLIGMIVDGLRPRDDSSPEPVPPLTEEELSRAVRTSARDPGGN